MKRALILSGGGSKGAYQAGAIDHLLGVEGINYEIFCGVSVGALNCAMLAMHAAGDEVAAAVRVHEKWKEIRTKDVRKQWFPFGILHALWKPSLYDSKPLITLVEEQMDVSKIISSGKQLAVGAVSLSTGQNRDFTQSDVDNIQKAVLASASFPAMLCPIEIDGELWTDGGVRDVTPIAAAIDLGADAIDVIMTSPVKKIIKFTKKPNTIDVAMQSNEILSDEVLENDIKLADMISELSSVHRRWKKQVTIRIIRPSESLKVKSLDFDRAALDVMMAQGLKDAQASGWKK